MNKQAIFDNAAARSVSVHLSVGTLRVKQHSFADIMTLETIENIGDRIATAIAISVIDEQGDPIFSRDDMEMIKSMRKDVVIEMWESVKRVNTISADDFEREKKD